MAYGLKYEYRITTRNGNECFLGIYQRDYSGNYRSLNGALQSIRVERMGENLIESAIVKSALTFTLVDMSGGQWQEFFTPDATLYRVTLSTDGDARWTGYITPDSFSESLSYRGSVAITARDMLGHMADIPFDSGVFVTSNNLVTVQDIVTKGIQICECPMRLSFNSTLQDHFGDVWTWLVDIRAFEGKNWYEVMEGLMDSLGLTMRWEDEDTIAVRSIMNSSTPMQFQSLQIRNNSGTRTFDPAYRMVEEKLSYDYFEGEVADLQKVITGDRLNGADGWSQNDQAKKIVASSQGREIGYFGDINGEDVAKHCFLYCVPHNGARDETVARKSIVLAPNTPTSVSFKVAHLYDASFNPLDTEENYNGGHTIPGSDLEAHLLFGRGHLPQGELSYAITWVGSNGTTLYLTNNGWGTRAKTFTYFFGRVGDQPEEQQFEQAWSSDIARVLSHSFTTPDSVGRLEIRLAAFRHYLKRDNYDLDTHTYWVSLGEFSIVPEVSAMPKDLKVTTKYNEAMNYTLTRKPMLGICPSGVEYAGACVNAFYRPVRGYPAIRLVALGQDSELPLPVIVAMQHIALHSRTTSVITGTISCQGDDTVWYNSAWNYDGASLRLVGGALDPIHDVIEGAILREFISFSGVWGQELDIDYTSKGGQKDLQLESIRNAAQSSSSSSSGTGGGIPEAPTDGGLYGRKNGTWQIITQSEGGSTVVWGEGTMNSITLTVDGVSKDLALANHTHDSYVTGMALERELENYQLVITDLSTIRTGAAAGATAVQPSVMTAALASKANDADVVHKDGVEIITGFKKFTHAINMICTNDAEEDTDIASTFDDDVNLITFSGTTGEVRLRGVNAVPVRNDDVVNKEYADTKYTKPAGGIPQSDLSSGVQNTLNVVAQLMDITRDLEDNKADIGLSYTKTQSDGRYMAKDGVKWGGNQGEYIQLTINGAGQIVALQGHTHEEFVTIAGEQTITGNKTFQGDVLFDGRISAGGNNIEDVADPTDPTDVATKAYVDAHIVDLDDVYTKIQADTRFVAKQEGARLYTEADELMMRNAITALGTAIIETEEGVKRYADNKFVEKREGARLFTEADQREFRGLISTLGQYASSLEERIYALEHAEQFVKLFLTSRYELSTYQFPRKFPNPNDGCIINCMTWNGYMYDGNPLSYRVVADDAVTIESNSYTNMAYKLGIPFRAEAGKTYRFSWQYLDADDNGTTDSRVELCYVGADGEIIDGDTYKYIEEGAGSFTVPAGCAWVILVLAGVGFDGDPATCYPINWYDMKLKKM